MALNIAFILQAICLKRWLQNPKVDRNRMDKKIIIDCSDWGDTQVIFGRELVCHKYGFILYLEFYNWSLHKGVGRGLAMAGNVYETFKLADPFKVLIAEVDCHFFFLRYRVSLTLECPAFWILFF